MKLTNTTFNYNSAIALGGDVQGDAMFLKNVHSTKDGHGHTVKHNLFIQDTSFTTEFASSTVSLNGVPQADCAALTPCSDGQYCSVRFAPLPTPPPLSLPRPPPYPCLVLRVTLELILRFKMAPQHKCMR